MLNHHLTEKEENLSEKQNAIDKMAAKILAQMDFGKATTTVYIRDIGDCSRYHETVALNYDQQEWSVMESYLTPEYSFRRQVKLQCLDRSNIAEWVKTLLSQNEVLLDENRSCPQNGLRLPNEMCCP